MKKNYDDKTQLPAWKTYNDSLAEGTHHPHQEDKQKWLEKKHSQAFTQELLALSNPSVIAYPIQPESPLTNLFNYSTKTDMVIVTSEDFESSLGGIVGRELNRAKEKIIKAEFKVDKRTPIQKIRDSMYKPGFDDDNYISHGDRMAAFLPVTDLSKKMPYERQFHTMQKNTDNDWNPDDLEPSDPIYTQGITSKGTFRINE